MQGGRDGYGLYLSDCLAYGEVVKVCVMFDLGYLSPHITYF